MIEFKKLETQAAMMLLNNLILDQAAEEKTASNMKRACKEAKDDQHAEQFAMFEIFSLMKAEIIKQAIVDLQKQIENQNFNF